VRVSVVIAARDAENSIGLTLQALQAQTFAGAYEVIVVDNGSADETAAVAEAQGARVIRRERGEGPGRARNDGVASASGEIIAFTDSDCEPDPRWLEAGLAAMADTDLLQGCVVPAEHAGPFDRTLWVTRAHGLFETANLFVRRALFVQLGGFGVGLEVDPSQQIGQARSGAPFGEDTVFGWRAVRAGARTGFAPDAVVRHEVVKRTGHEWLAERRRDGLFPGLVKQLPEIRRDPLFLRYFLNERHAAATLLLPYLWFFARDARQHGLRVASVLAVGTVVGMARCVAGSFKARALVI
jgi:glycosyltransferase involved in cell wall biosynthesis